MPRIEPGRVTAQVDCGCAMCISALEEAGLDRYGNQLPDEPMPEPELYAACRMCGESFPQSEMHDTRLDRRSRWVCESCYDYTTICDNCNDLVHTDDTFGYEGYTYCESCYDEATYDPEPEDDYEDEYDSPSDQQEVPDFASEEHSTSEGLSFTPRFFNPQRGNMIASVELEFGGSPEPLSEAIYRRGLSTSPGMVSYSSTSGPACVKYDGSVGGGGELVISMVDTGRQSDVYRMWHTMDALRRRVKDGQNTLDMRCGTHVHIDARGLTTANVITTVTVFNHLEDILYRLAAANYSSHRSVGRNNGYCGIIRKSLRKEQLRNVGDRYLGLNLSNFINWRYNCDCGAGFHGDDCTCPGRKLTLEFRLWNSTANSIKLHAYVALSAALVAYGQDNPDMDFSHLPDMPFTHGTCYFHNEAQAREYASRLVWMLTELPLSREERDSIRYCIRNCDIGSALDNAARGGWLEQELVAGICEDDSLLEFPERRAPRQRPRDARGRFVALTY